MDLLAEIRRTLHALRDRVRTRDPAQALMLDQAASSLDVGNLAVARSLVVPLSYSGDDDAKELLRILDALDQLWADTCCLRHQAEFRLRLLNQPQQPKGGQS